MFVKISIEEFAESTVKNNPGTNKKKLIKDLKSALERKKNGAVCVLCGSTIWAAGSAVTGTDMCFTCMTGEDDDSDDYEIE